MNFPVYTTAVVGLGVTGLQHWVGISHRLTVHWQE